MPNAVLRFVIPLLSACLAMIPAFSLVRGSVESPAVFLDEVSGFFGLASCSFSGTAVHDLSPIASVEYSCDYGLWMLAEAVDGTFGESTSEEFLFNTASLVDGAHVIQVRATTSAGYTTAPAEYATAFFAVDTVNPFLTLDPVFLDPTSSRSPEIVGQAEDSGSPIVRVEYSIDSGDWLPATALDGDFDSPEEDYSICLTALSEGEHIVEARAVDAAGNASAPVKNAFTIDTRGPAVTLDSVPAHVSQLPLVFSGETVDLYSRVASVRFRVNGGEWLAAAATDGAFDESFEPWTFSVAEIPEGTHDIEVTGEDTLGNMTSGQETAVASFIVDTTPPDLCFDSPDGVTADHTCLTVKGVASDLASPVTSVQYRIDGGEWVDAEPDDGTFDGMVESFTVSFNRTPQDAYLIQTRAVDAAGNGFAPEPIRLEFSAANNGDAEQPHDIYKGLAVPGRYQLWWPMFLLPGLAVGGLVTALVMARRRKTIVGRLPDERSEPPRER